MNLRYSHIRRSQEHPNGGRISKENPIHISNVLPIDENGHPTRVGRRYEKQPVKGCSRWLRVAKTTGKDLDN